MNFSFLSICWSLIFGGGDIYQNNNDDDNNNNNNNINNLDNGIGGCSQVCSDLESYNYFSNYKIIRGFDFSTYFSQKYSPQCNFTNKLDAIAYCNTDDLCSHVRCDDTICNCFRINIKPKMSIDIIQTNSNVTIYQKKICFYNYNASSTLTSNAHSDKVVHCNTLSDSTVLCAAEDHTALILDKKFNVLAKFSTNSRGFQGMDQLLNGDLALGDYDGFLSVYGKTGANYTLKKTWDSQQTWVRSIVVCSDGLIVSIGYTTTDNVKFWDSTTYAAVKKFTASGYGIVGLCLPQNKLAIGTTNANVGIWDSNTCTLVRYLNGHSGWIGGLVLLPNQNLASCGSDRLIKIWDFQSGICLKTLSGHTDAIYALAQINNGYLASASADQTVMIWNTYTGQYVQTLYGHSKDVYTVTSFSNGNLVSGSFDYTMKIWQPLFD